MIKFSTEIPTYLLLFILQKDKNFDKTISNIKATKSSIEFYSSSNCPDGTLLNLSKLAAVLAFH
jgi:hypothetical protein